MTDKSAVGDPAHSTFLKKTECGQKTLDKEPKL